MKVSQVMTKDVITVSADESVSFAAKLLHRHNLGALPVCEETGALRGVVTDRDLVTRCLALNLNPEKTTLRDVMSRWLVTAGPADEVEKAAELMAKGQVRRLPVVKDGELVGMVSLGDIATAEDQRPQAAMALERISENIRRL